MKKSFLMVFVLMLFSLFNFNCKSPTTPEPPEPPVIEYVDVEIKYLRVDDTPVCPVIRPDTKDVLLRGDLPIGEYPTNKMQEIENLLFYIKVFNVRVNQPPLYSGDKAYTVYILDNAFTDIGLDVSCATRAHKMWINGKLITKIRSGGNRREYLRVRIDKFGNIYEE